MTNPEKDREFIKVTKLPKSKSVNSKILGKREKNKIKLDKSLISLYNCFHQKKIE